MSLPQVVPLGRATASSSPRHESAQCERAHIACSPHGVAATAYIRHALEMAVKGKLRQI